MTPEIPDRPTTLRVLATLVVLAAVVPFVVFAVPSLAGADQSYVVLSSSMSPELRAGDVILVTETPTDSISTGDVITFRSSRAPTASGGDAEYVTHRVVEVVERDGGTYFRTKGDANDAPDRRLVPSEAVAGNVVFSLPLAGHVVLFARSQLGFVALVVAPLALLVLTEVRSLVAAAREQRDASEEPKP
jgi:signal peptidase